jgi:DNA-binding beta-propeller fold protein YncE
VRALLFVLSATVALACGRGPPSVTKHNPGAAWTGPDAVLVRLPMAGGGARAYRWGRDSVLWTSSQPVPALARLLAFDDEQGALAFVDLRGAPGRLELRLGVAVPVANAPMSSLASADGWAVYGITAKQEVQRLTPSGNWTYGSALTPRLLLPQPDGSLVLLNDLGSRSVLRRLHPPEARVTDTASVPKAAWSVATALGDRIYFATDSGLAGVRVRDLARTKTISLSGPAIDAVPTPSGDRIYVALAGEPTISVIDRYEERVVRTIGIGAPAAALRMDPDGRYLLVQRDGQDSAAVISVADSKVIRVIATRWRGDLPLVAPDGAVLALDSTDAIDVDPASGKVRHRYENGASDLWALIRWNGFRPRAKGLDQPVNFEADSTDSTAVSPPDTAVAAAPLPRPVVVPQAAPPTPRDEPAPEPKKPAVWTLSFAALLDEQRAKTLALAIRVDGKPVKVVPGARDGVAIWRIVYGPFATRDDAERAGRRTGLPFWVYEDVP